MPSPAATLYALCLNLVVVCRLFCRDSFGFGSGFMLWCAHEVPCVKGAPAQHEPTLVQRPVLA